MSFEKDFAAMLDAAAIDVATGKPRAVLVRLGKGSSSGPVLRVLDGWAGNEWAVWHARADDRSRTLAEQLLPEGVGGSAWQEDPPRVDTVLLTLKGGLNVCAVSRRDSSLDPDILSGMMEAVRNFISDSLRMQTGAELDGAGAERFEMHGHTILNVGSGISTLSVIMTGSAGPGTEGDIRRIASSIESRFGEMMRAWRGSSEESSEVRGALERAFFSSGLYDGEWDVATIHLRQAKAQDDVLETALSASRERPLAIAVDGLDGADEASVDLLAYLTKNARGSKLLFVLSIRMAERSIEKLEPVLAVSRESLGLETIDHPGHASLDEILAPCEVAARGDALALLEGWAVAGSMDIEAVAEISGLGQARAEAALSALAATGFEISAGEIVDPYLAEMAFSGMPDARRVELFRKGAGSLRERRPDDVVRIAELLVHIAGADPTAAVDAAAFSEAAAKRLTGAVSLRRAEAMWLEVHKFAETPEKRLEGLWNAMELERMQNRSETLSANLETLLSEASGTGLETYIWKAHWMRGRVELMEKAADRGLASLEAAEGILRRLGDDGGLACVINSKGVFKNQLGETDEAISMYRTAIELSSRAGNLMLKARILVNLGSAFRMKGDFDSAESAMAEGYALASEIGSRADIPTILWHLSLLSFHRGDYERCARIAHDALEAAKDAGDWKTMVRSLTTRAAALDKLGKFDEVEKATLEALLISERTRVGDRLAIIYNIYEVKHKQQLAWLRRMMEAAGRGDGTRETQLLVKSELLRPLLEQLELLNEFVDSSGDPQLRSKLVDQLESLMRNIDG